MLLIECPHCGPRDETEYVYAGDATCRRPAPDAALEEWAAYVYQRDNPRGPHREYWHHRLGCGAVVVVERDTLTHDIADKPRPAAESVR